MNPNVTSLLFCSCELVVVVYDEKNAYILQKFPVIVVRYTFCMRLSVSYSLVIDRLWLFLWLQYTHTVVCSYFWRSRPTFNFHLGFVAGLVSRHRIGQAKQVALGWGQPVVYTQLSGWRRLLKGFYHNPQNNFIVYRRTRGDMIEVYIILTEILQKRELRTRTP